MSSDRLRAYEDRRDRGATPEPFTEDRYEADVDGPLFVIQEHDASSHHFDVRLEIDGVLASWAVPKGPSTDPSEKRLALRTEDHPLGYADFEGVIPEDEYGGGTVSIWDRGPYRNLKEETPLDQQLDGGHLTVFLEGEKLRGGYALTRFESAEDEEEEEEEEDDETGGEKWLLVKMDDDEADARRRPTKTEPDSVLSGRTLDEIAEDEEPTSFE